MRLLELERPDNVVRFPLKPRLEAAYRSFAAEISEKYAGTSQDAGIAKDRLEGVARLAIDLYAVSNPRKYPFFDEAQDELAELGALNAEIPECLGIILQTAALGILGDLPTGNPHPKILQILQILNRDDDQEILSSPMARAVKVADLLYLSNLIPWRYEGIAPERIQEHQAILNRLGILLAP